MYAWFMLFITCFAFGSLAAGIAVGVLRVIDARVSAKDVAHAPWRARHRYKAKAGNVALMYLMALGVILVTSAAISAGIITSNSDSIVGDTEILSGRVIGKSQETVGCSHSYSCNCRPVVRGYGKDQYTVIECDTCYEHTHDYDWMVQTTVGDIEIDRVDRQGVDIPPRWAAVVKDEPVAKEHRYKNWIKGAKASAFNREGERLSKTYAIPAYPSVYDYYRIRRIASDNPSLFGGKLDAAERSLADALRGLGPDKQVSVSIFHTSRYDREYGRAVYNAFSGGKKNDVMVVIGTDTVGKINWVTVTSYSTNDLVNVKMRDDIMALDNVARVDEIVSKITDDIARHFSRKRMRTFEYLSNDIEYVSTTEIVILCICMSVFGAGVVAAMRRNDMF